MHPAEVPCIVTGASFFIDDFDTAVIADAVSLFRLARARYLFLRWLIPLQRSIADACDVHLLPWRPFLLAPLFAQLKP